MIRVPENIPDTFESVTGPVDTPPEVAPAGTVPENNGRNGPGPLSGTASIEIRTAVIDDAPAAERITVVTGIADGDWIAVSGGISPGDRVVVRGGERLKAGDSVSITRLDSKE